MVLTTKSQTTFKSTPGIEVPKSVEKKTGRSGMSVVPGQSQAEVKRADEVINDEYTHDADTDESDEYNDFMQKPKEGGQDDPMFDYEKSNTKTADDIDSDESSVSEGELANTSESVEESKENGNAARFQYRFPFLNAHNLFKGYGLTSNSRSENMQSSENTSDQEEVMSESSNESDDNESSDDLDQLQQKGLTRNADDNSNDKQSNSDDHFINM